VISDPSSMVYMPMQLFTSIDQMIDSLDPTHGILTSIVSLFFIVEIYEGLPRTSKAFGFLAKYPGPTIITVAYIIAMVACGFWKGMPVIMIALAIPTAPLEFAMMWWMIYGIPELAKSMDTSSRRPLGDKARLVEARKKEEQP